MKQFSILSIRGLAYSFVFILCMSCKKDLDSTNPSQLSSESVSTSASSSILSQTRTANLFNRFGEAVLLLWQKGDHQSVSADDGSYAYSKKLSSGRSPLQLQLHDFRFDIPTGAKIESITVNARRFATGKGSIRDHLAYLIKRHDLVPTTFAAYGIVWSNHDYYPKNEATANYFQNGSGTNGVGNNAYEWTAEMINDFAFGLRIFTNDPVGTVVVYYDMVSITVQYSLPDVYAPVNH